MSGSLACCCCCSAKCCSHLCCAADSLGVLPTKPCTAPHRLLAAAAQLPMDGRLQPQCACAHTQRHTQQRCSQPLQAGSTADPVQPGARGSAAGRTSAAPGGLARTRAAPCSLSISMLMAWACFWGFTGPCTHSSEHHNPRRPSKGRPRRLRAAWGVVPAHGCRHAAARRAPLVTLEATELDKPAQVPSRAAHAWHGLHQACWIWLQAGRGPRRCDMWQHQARARAPAGPSQATQAGSGLPWA